VPVTTRAGWEAWAVVAAAGFDETRQRDRT
jgi:hypothetical protein